MGTLSLAISGFGIIVFLAAMIPNFAYMLLAPQEQIEDERKKSHLNAEDLSRDFFAFFLVAFVAEEKASIVYLIVAIVFLLLYYLTWMRYFKNGKKTEYLLSPLGFVPVPLAIFPNIYFAFASLYLNNMLAFSLCLIFAFFHIKEALKEYKKMKEEAK
ncbi:MAG: hypothetical protein MSS69_08180 [Spirochaetales bacterium]|nr:hypothetical protein [Spirochaetales bacterium]